MPNESNGASMNSDEFRKAAHSAIDEVVDYYDTIQDRRVVSNVEPGYLRKLLPSSPPEEGERWVDIQKDIEAKIMPGLTHWQSPSFMAFFPAMATYPSMLGELYSAAFTAPAFNWLCSPAVTELETIVLDWLARLLHLPDCFQSSGKGGGVIQGSASEAIVVVMVAARERYLKQACGDLEGKERDDKINDVRGRLIALGSEQSHSSTVKAALIAGVRFKPIPTHMADDLALTGHGLATTLEECKTQNFLPFYLTTTLGTTATCAVDHFATIASTVSTHLPPNSCWLHVDAAYAGAALILEECAHFTSHFAYYDSFNMNMHKWLLVNFDASCLFIRHRSNLTSALSITPSYLMNSFSDRGLVTDYRDWQIPLGRRFRALKIWFVLRSYGSNAMKALLRKHIAMGEEFARWVREEGEMWTVVTPPAFALTVITLKIHEYTTRQTRNALTKQIYERINTAGEIFLTSGLVDGIFVIRVVSANERADEAHLRRAFEILKSVGNEVLTENQGDDGLEGIAEYKK